MLGTCRLILIYCDMDFKRVFFSTLYVKSNSNGDVIVVCLYVDDLIFIENCPYVFEDFKEPMKQQFEMKNLGLMSYFLSFTACEAFWLRRMLSELKYEQRGPTKILCDYKFVIAMTKNPMFYDRRKCINIEFHYIRELVKNEEIELEFYRSKDQAVDILESH